MLLSERLEQSISAFYIRREFLYIYFLLPLHAQRKHRQKIFISFMFLLLLFMMHTVWDLWYLNFIKVFFFLFSQTSKGIIWALSFKLDSLKINYSFFCSQFQWQDFQIGVNLEERHSLTDKKLHFWTLNFHSRKRDKCIHFSCSKRVCYNSF